MQSWISGKEIADSFEERGDEKSRRPVYLAPTYLCPQPPKWESQVAHEDGCSLLTLPYEVRGIIWRHLFQCSIIKIEELVLRPGQLRTSQNWGRSTVKYRNKFNILKSCRQFQVECLPYMFAASTLYFSRDLLSYDVTLEPQYLVRLVKQVHLHGLSVPFAITEIFPNLKVVEIFDLTAICTNLTAVWPKQPDPSNDDLFDAILQDGHFRLDAQESGRKIILYDKMRPFDLRLHVKFSLRQSMRMLQGPRSNMYCGILRAVLDLTKKVVVSRRREL